MVGIQPTTRLVICDAELEALLQLTRKWMMRNVGSGRRGTRWPGHGLHWVYERAGQHCIRCDSTIRRTKLGTPPRVTFFCPQCQPTHDRMAP